ncbi:hypothetical protein GCM10009646_61470 [Streptomyces aureus]
MTQQRASRARQPDPPALLDHQFHAHVGGELAQLVRDGRRRVMQDLRRRGHRAVLGDHLKDAEPGVNHGNSLRDTPRSGVIPLRLTELSPTPRTPKGRLRSLGAAVAAGADLATGWAPWPRPAGTTRRAVR